MCIRDRALLRFNAAITCRWVARRKSTLAGDGIPCSRPSVFTQLQRELWRCAATVRIVRGVSGIGMSQSAFGKRSMSSVVTRLFVRHAASTLGPRSGAGIVGFLEVACFTEHVMDCLLYTSDAA